MEENAAAWTSNEVVLFLKNIGFGNCENSARENEVTGKDLLGLVDEPLSTVQQMFGVGSQDGRTIRQHIRNLRLKAKGNVDALGRAVAEEAETSEAPNSRLYPAIRALASTRMDRMNIVAVGKTGQGKSSTLNTILHYNGIPDTQFDELCGMRSATKSVEQKQIAIHGISLRLVDTIGLFDTDEEPTAVAKELSRVIQVCSDGIHAFLIVVKMTERLTKESQETINIIRQYFGTHLLNYAFFVLTGADVIDNEQLRQQQVQALAKYTGIDWVESRVIFFNNVSRSPEQVEELIDRVAQNVDVQGGPYTNAAFEIAQEELQRAIEAERIRAEEEKRLLIADATAEIIEASEAEKRLLEERYKNDKEALEKALKDEEAKTATAIAEAEAAAQAKYNHDITEIMRNHEEVLQEKLATQTEIMFNQQKEIREQFEAELKQMREQHEQSLEEQRRQVKESEQKQQEHFRSLIERTEAAHREEMAKLQERQDLDSKERERRENELREHFNAQIATYQAQSSEACREQREQFRRLQEEAAERHTEAMQMMQQFQAQQMSSLQSQVAALQGRECTIL